MSFTRSPRKPRVCLALEIEPHELLVKRGLTPILYQRLRLLFKHREVGIPIDWARALHMATRAAAFHLVVRQNWHADNAGGRPHVAADAA